MSFYPHSTTCVGIERTTDCIRTATLHKKSSGWEIANLREIPIDSYVKPTEKLPRDAIFATSLSSREVLVRICELPLKKEKDIIAALPFQIEPHLPYPIDRCVLQHTPLHSHANGTTLCVFSTKKETLQHHLNQWNKFSLDPDSVTCAPEALACFSSLLPPSDEPLLLLHLGEREGTCVLLEKGKVLFARPVEKELQEIEKTLLAMAASPRAKKAEKLYLLCADIGIAEKIQKITDLKVTFPELPLISQENLLKFGFAIGIALAGGEEERCNFRESTSPYIRLWKKIQKPLFTFCTLAIALCSATFALTTLLLYKQEKAVQKRFTALLELGKTPTEGPWTKEKISQSLKEQEAALAHQSDTFPLTPSLPKVSDLLAWLSAHPLLNPSQKEDAIEIDGFRYVLEKYPSLQNPHEHYLVKVEIEYSSLNPNSARALHDVLVINNPFVDAKKEIQWTPNKGRYFLSFYLKDKTRYTS